MTGDFKLPARVAWGIVGILMLGLCPLPAQTPASNRGFWIGLGFGGGQGAANREAGATFFTSVAGGVSDRLVLGAEANIWISGLGAFTPSDSAETERQDFALLAYYYLRARPGLFLKAGITASRYRANYPPLWRTAIGPGLLAGLGYDARISSALYLRPVLTLTVGFLGDVTEEDQFLQRAVVATGVTQHVVKLELGLMFHPQGR